jgi:hypothetical protein
MTRVSEGVCGFVKSKVVECDDIESNIFILGFAVGFTAVSVFRVLQNLFQLNEGKIKIFNCKCFGK